MTLANLNIYYTWKIIIEKYKTRADDPPVEIYIKKIKNRIVFKIKTDIC